MSNTESKDADALMDFVATLQAEAGLEKPRSLPPVHLWNPEHCGDIGLEIRKDGSWWQDGVRFSRQKLVRLFSTILRRDEDGYYLVTPHEKVVIEVEDAPFTAIRLDRTEQDGEVALAATTNVGDVVLIGEDNPLRVETDPETGEPSTYVMIRNGLEARLARPPYYELVGWASEDPDTRMMSIESCGARFELGRTV